MEKRTIVYTLRLTETELQQLAESAETAEMRLSRYVREAALKGTVTHTPSVNKVQWAALGGLANNLNQVTRSIHLGRADSGSLQVIEAIRPVVQEIREALLP